MIFPVGNVDHAAAPYGKLLQQPGRRVSSGRHYFACDGAILACFDPKREDGYDAKPNPEHVYFAVADLEAVFERARSLGCSELDAAIKIQPWGERSFYGVDPFGNSICFVDDKTLFTGT